MNTPEDDHAQRRAAPRYRRGPMPGSTSGLESPSEPLRPFWPGADGLWGHSEYDIHYTMPEVDGTWCGRHNSGYVHLTTKPEDVTCKRCLQMYAVAVLLGKPPHLA